MTQENPFPLVHGKSLADACEPQLDLDLPNFRLVPVQEGIVVLLPVAMFEEEPPNENAQGTAASKTTLGQLRRWGVDRDDGVDRHPSRQALSGSARRLKEEAGEGDKDRQLVSAFVRLRGLVGESHWTMSSTPYVICHNAAGKCLTLHQEQADAIHIVTFAIGDVLYDRCLRNLRSGDHGPSTQRGRSARAS